MYTQTKIKVLLNYWGINERTLSIYAILGDGSTRRMAMINQRTDSDGAPQIPTVNWSAPGSSSQALVLAMALALVRAAEIVSELRRCGWNQINPPTDGGSWREYVMPEVHFVDGTARVDASTGWRVGHRPRFEQLSARG